MNLIKQIGKTITAKACTIGCFALLFSSCGSSSDNRFAKEDIDESNVKPYDIIRFDKEVMTLDPNQVPEGMSKLLGKYGDLFDTYLKEGVNVGPAYSQEDGKSINTNTAAIISNEILRNGGYQYFFHAEDSVFKDGLKGEMNDLSHSLNRFKHFFPEKPVPSKVIAMFSCFGPQMAVGGDNVLMVSLDYYIGSNFKAYRQVDGLYDYLIKNLDRKNMAKDMTLGWIYNCFPEANANNNRLIDEMIYQGKLMYILEACCNQKEPYELMGYNKDQWEWCVANEGEMWNCVKTNNHLYTRNRLTISKYIEPAAHTAYFPFDESKQETPEAPGKAGIWLGWRIVSSYMSKHKNATLADLMKETDSQKLLEESGYNPKHAATSSNETSGNAGGSAKSEEQEERTF